MVSSRLIVGLKNANSEGRGFFIPDRLLATLPYRITEGLPVNQDLCALQEVRGQSPRDIIPACDNLCGI
jgi:hypothetical protein